MSSGFPASKFNSVLWMLPQCRDDVDPILGWTRLGLERSEEWGVGMGGCTAHSVEEGGSEL